MVFLVGISGKIYNGRGTHVFHLLQGSMVEHGVVLQQETAVEHEVAVGHVEGFQRTFVDIAQYAVFVVVQHVEQARFEYGMIAYKQPVDLLLAEGVGSNVMLDTHQTCGTSVSVTAHHLDVYFIVFAHKVIDGT